MKSGSINGNIAMKALGLHFTTHYRWMDIGEEEYHKREAGIEPDPKKDLHVEYYTRILAAQSDTALEMLTVIKEDATVRKSADSAWRWIKRYSPEEFETDRTQVVNINIKQIPSGVESVVDLIPLADPDVVDAEFDEIWVGDDEDTDGQRVG